MTTTSTAAAFDQSAPQAERTDALAELMQNHRPIDSEVREVIEFINEDLQDQTFRKAIADNVVPFPPNRRGKPGMQSVDVDEYQILVNGDFIERPGALNFDSMRAMVEQTPVLSSIVMTRIRQVARFCRVQESGSGPGFCIRHVDRDHELQASEHESIQLMQRFFDNCGWEFNPRRRRALRRDSFTQFMGKLVRDTLILDAASIETEMKRDRSLGIDGLYAVDGGTIRLCTEEGYNGADEIFALQVVQGRVRTAYTFDDLIYEPRNPRSDILSAGYGLSEVEMLVKTVTGYLNALTYNQKFFDSNSIPKGILHLTGNYDTKDLAAFKRYWNSMVKGVNNAWSLPVLVSKDQESRAGFERFGVEANEMLFARWMTFLTAVCCAIYGMDPAEINSDAFSAGSSPLSGSDTAERLAASKDKGLRPLLSYFENLFTDYVVRDFSDKYVFRWTGLDEEDEDKRHELRKMVLTVNEARAQEGYDPLEGPMGDAPLNPSLVGPWMQLTQQQGDEQEDFGQPPEGEDEKGEGEEQGTQDDGAGGSDGEPTVGPDEGDQGGAPPAEAVGDEGEQVAKSFGLPVMTIWGDDEEARQA